MRLFILSLFISFGTFGQTKLMMIGGGKRPTDIIQKFGNETKSSEILIITWASGEPQASFEAIKKDFDQAGSYHLTKAPDAPLSPTLKANFLEQLSKTGAVFFTGGDQNRIMEVLKDEEVLNALYTKYLSGIIFGGTSAGTAIMSDIMITGKGDFTVIDPEKVETAKGFGLVKNMIVDQHFIKRQRQNRLLSLLYKHPKLYGVGIDEDTALYLENGKKGTVYGNSQVMVFKNKKGKIESTLCTKGQKVSF